MRVEEQIEELRRDLVAKELRRRLSDA